MCRFCFTKVKRGSSKKCWSVLRGQYLCYYKSEDDMVSCFWINLEFSSEFREIQLLPEPLVHSHWVPFTLLRVCDLYICAPIHEILLLTDRCPSAWRTWLMWLLRSWNLLTLKMVVLKLMWYLTVTTPWWWNHSDSLPVHTCWLTQKKRRCVLISPFGHLYYLSSRNDCLYTIASKRLFKNECRWTSLVCLEETRGTDRVENSF